MLLLRVATNGILTAIDRFNGSNVLLLDLFIDLAKPVFLSLPSLAQLPSETVETAKRTPKISFAGWNLQFGRPLVGLDAISI